MIDDLLTIRDWGLRHSIDDWANGDLTIWSNGD
jgi:hypothetical protein